MLALSLLRLFDWLREKAVICKPITANQISFMGGDEEEVKTVGHIVHWVEKSGPADYAGLRDGDKIMEINDTNVAEMDYEDVMKIINEVEGNEIKAGF